MACDENKGLHVNHILSKSKYPEYIDGDYHGSKNNNFICFCNFHHFVYHYLSGQFKDDPNDKKAAVLLWSKLEEWCKANNRSISDYEIEREQILSKFNNL